MKKIKEVIRTNNKFLISGHPNIDGDLIGSSLALFYLIKSRGKTVDIVFGEPVPKQFSFLDDLKVIKYAEQRIKKNYDVAILIECSLFSRLPSIIDLKKFKFVVNIDHHPSEPEFGDLNIIMPDTASSTEIVYRIIKSMGMKISKREALPLYVGLLTDTGNFQWANTSPQSLKLASQLLETGIDTLQIYKNIYATKSLSFIKRIGELFERIRTKFNGKLIYLEISDPPDKLPTDDVMNYLNVIEGGKVFILFRKFKPNRVRVNFRSLGDVEVEKVASVFGGGGHKFASACWIKDDQKEKIFKEVRKYL